MAEDYESSDDAKNLSLAADREAVEYEGEKIAKPLREAAKAKKAEPLKMASFGEAFREARNRGDKTFEWQGKKYTTELASEKKVKPAAPAVSDRSVMKADSGGYGSTDRVAYNRATREKMAADKKAAAGAGYKKGGSVKSYSIDGIAKRGKTRAKQK